MSEEIVERLKAEGQLTRNTGTNSIRAVRIQMDKFEAIFETISEQVTLQTKLLADMVETSMDQLRINSETAEREKARQQREDLADAQEEEDRDEPDDAAPARAEREGPGLFSMLSGMGMGKLLMGGALLGAGMFAAYNIAKGFVDERTGGGWSAFEDAISDIVTNIDWAAFRESMGRFIENLPLALETFTEFLTNPAVMILGALTAGSVGRGVLSGIAQVATASLLRSPQMLALGLGIGMIYALVQGTADTIERAKNFLTGGEQIFASDEEEEAYRSGALQETTPSRAAAITAKLNAAAQERQEIIRNKAELSEGAYYEGLEFENFANDIRKINELLGTDYQIPGRSPEEEAARQEQLRLEEEARRSQELRDQARDYARRNPGLFDPADYVDQFERRRRSNEFNRSMAAQNTPYDVGELSSSLYDEAMRNADRFFADPNYRVTIGSSSPSDLDLLRSATENYLRDVANFDASRYQFGNDERVSEAASGAGGTAVILNYNPNIAPVTNNVQGGPNVSSTTVFGSGSGNRSSDTYGITNGAN